MSNWIPPEITDADRESFWGAGSTYTAPTFDSTTFDSMRGGRANTYIVDYESYNQLIEGERRRLSSWNKELTPVVEEPFYI